MAQHKGLLPRYKQLRKIGMHLNSRLVETLSKEELNEGGKKLGILKKNVLVLDTEDEIAVLMDFCIHDVRRAGGNAVDRYLVKSPPQPNSEEAMLLQALQAARFTLLKTVSAEAGVGAYVHDLLKDEPDFLMDVGLSQSAALGFVLACRIVEVDGIHMTTGAVLPVGTMTPAVEEKYLNGLAASLKKPNLRHLLRDEVGNLAASVLRACLQAGAAQHISYKEPDKSSQTSGRVSHSPAPKRTGRNDPCPCGSGKKFKHCCGGR